jgi:hypothetical protein
MDHEAMEIAIRLLQERLETIGMGLDAYRREAVQLRADCLAELERVSAILEVHSTALGARNKSAPLKKNMTDADALRVMTGDLKGLDHKEAGEAAGLTYAQVYSCRKEFTFKHVHKDLRDAKWRNPWAK